MELEHFTRQAFHRLCPENVYHYMKREKKDQTLISERLYLALLMSCVLANLGML